mgnify:CR=1 FL=1
MCWQKTTKTRNSHCRDRVHYAVSDTTPESTPKGWNASYVCRWSIAAGKRPVPFRTRKLSLHTLMVLQPGGCGRVSHRRHQTTKTQQNTNKKKRTVYHRPLLFAFYQPSRPVEGLICKARSTALGRPRCLHQRNAIKPPGGRLHARTNARPLGGEELWSVAGRSGFPLWVVLAMYLRLVGSIAVSLNRSGRAFGLALYGSRCGSARGSKFRLFVCGL